MLAIDITIAASVCAVLFHFCARYPKQYRELKLTFNILFWTLLFVALASTVSNFYLNAVIYDAPEYLKMAGPVRDHIRGAFSDHRSFMIDKLISLIGIGFWLYFLQWFDASRSNEGVEKKGK